MKKATTDERTKRTEADDVEPARTDEDSRRWKQPAVVTTEDNNPVTTINFINSAARDANKLTQQQTTKLRKLRNKLS